MAYPIFNMMNEWFIERRGLALGVICASTGITGLFIPFVLNFLLHKYGPANTLRISALALLLLCGPCLPLLKPRLPNSHVDTVPAADYSFLKMPLFYCFALAQLLQGLGFYLPTFYLPSYAISMGLSGTMGAFLLVIASFSQVLGQMAFGCVSDMRIKRLWIDGRVPVHILLFVSTFMSGISILALWGPARSQGMLIAFATVYGMSAGGFAVLWARMVRPFFPLLQPGNLFIFLIKPIPPSPSHPFANVSPLNQSQPPSRLPPPWPSQPSPTSPAPRASAPLSPAPSAPPSSPAPPPPTALPTRMGNSRASCCIRALACWRARQSWWRGDWWGGR